MTGAVIRVYRAGFSRIESPDVGIDKRNADFGGGFHTSPDRGFVSRRARVRDVKTPRKDQSSCRGSSYPQAF